MIEQFSNQSSLTTLNLSTYLAQEKELFEGAGLEFPDVIHLAGFAALKKWTGSIKDMPNLILKKFKRHDLVRKAEKEEEEEEEEEQAEQEEEELEIAKEGAARKRGKEQNRRMTRESKVKLPMKKLV